MLYQDRNNVQVAGAGPDTLVFAHGFACDQAMWKFVEPAFRDDHKTVRYDLTGCGRSNLNSYSFEKYGSLKGHADDLLEILAGLDGPPVTLVGHSLSGMIGLAASLQQPDRFRRLILLGSSPCYINDAEYKGGFEPAQVESFLTTLDLNYLSWAHSTAPVVMRNPERPELSAELSQTFCSNDARIASHFARTTFYQDSRQELARCHTPALILQASDDIIAPLPAGEYLHRHLPDSEFTLLQATGHYANLSAPESVIAAMRSFLTTP